MRIKGSMLELLGRVTLHYRTIKILVTSNQANCRFSNNMKDTGNGNARGKDAVHGEKLEATLQKCSASDAERNITHSHVQRVGLTIPHPP